jgi:hypothetical protein
VVQPDLHEHMKYFLLFSSLLSIATFPAYAGNMFGPAPFRNGSPLVSGIDGTYQATARASNITGIFRFAYAGGSQTTIQRQNNWIFFREGLVIRGDVEANINQSNLNGILSPPQAISGSTNTNAVFPLILISSDSSSVGTFNGKLNLKNSSGAFSGEGVFQSASSEVTTYTIVNTNLNPVQPIPVTNASGTGFTNNFYFRGVRTSTSSSSSVNSTN